MEVNKNIQHLKPSATLAINQKVAELKASGKKIYHFGFGQSPFPIHPRIVKALQKHAGNNKYLPSTGLTELRQEIVRYLQSNHQIDRSASFTYIGPGSKELLFQTIMILEGLFLVPRGSWVSYVPQITIKGGAHSILPTYPDKDYKLDPETLHSFCESHLGIQKTLILNSPNNPTGAVYSENELIELAEVCKEFELIVLSDEIYNLINFESNISPSIATYYPEKTIVYGGLSKIFSAGGYRLGFMSLPEVMGELHRLFRSLFSETFSAVAAPIQYAALEAFSFSPEIKEQIDKNAKILKAIANYVYEELSKTGIECTQPQGAYYMLIDLQNFREGLEQLKLSTSPQIASYLLEENGVALLPGTDFYFEPEDLIFRLAFVDFNGADWYELDVLAIDIDTKTIEDLCPNITGGIAKLREFVLTVKNESQIES